jgi:hypothetical protein
MKLLALLCLVMGILFTPLARAGVPEVARMEVEYLLDFLQISGCDFYRNGKWYDSSKARAHLSGKFEYLDARNRLKTAEDFIDDAATGSSLSGRPYEVRCLEHKSVPAGPWLHDVLNRYRAVLQPSTLDKK